MTVTAIKRFGSQTCIRYYCQFKQVPIKLSVFHIFNPGIWDLQGKSRAVGTTGRAGNCDNRQEAGPCSALGMSIFCESRPRPNDKRAWLGRPGWRENDRNHFNTELYFSDSNKIYTICAAGFYNNQVEHHGAIFHNSQTSRKNVRLTKINIRMMEVVHC